MDIEENEELLFQYVFDTKKSDSILGH